MPNLRLLLAAGLIAAGLCQPALTQEKSAVEIKTKTLDGSVTIDAKLKVYPTLYANLLTSGKRELDKWRKDADAEHKTNPDFFSEGRRWSFERSYLVRSIIGRYLSILRSDDTYGGGAHPNHVINTLLWDAQAGKMINVRPFFAEAADDGPTLQTLAKAIRAALAVEKKERGIDIDDPEQNFSLAGVKAKLTEIGALALAPSTEAGKSAGLIAYFSPYAVGSYAEGPYTVFVAWTEFKQYLSPAGAALFAGKRLPDDEKTD